MSNIHLDAVFDNWNAMHNVAGKLQSMANSFEVTGNRHVAEALWDASDEIMIWANRVRDTHGEKLSDDLARSSEATANILTALVGGIEIGKGKK